MKDARFIELVNLYIDRQISAEETAELEQEIQAHPRRRQVYNQYCRMHRATTLVYDSFRQNAPATQAPSAGHATIERIALRRRTQRNRWLAAAGGLTAAACVALALARVNPPVSAPASLAAKSVQPAVVAAAPVSPAAAALPASRPSFMSLQNQLGDEHYAALLTALRVEQERAMTLARAQSDRAPSLPASLFDDDVFAARQVLPVGVRRPASQPVRQGEGQAEFAAFKFQR